MTGQHGMAWQLRRAGAADLAAIMVLETGTFGSDAWTTRTMRSELANAHCYYLVAERLDGAVDGTGVLDSEAAAQTDGAASPESAGGIDGYAGLLAPLGARQADIQTIAVAQTARRGGLGRTLVQTLVAEARTRGAEEVFLEVRADNPGAQALYLTLGFEQIAVRVGYYQPDGVDALVMRLVIREPELRPAGTV
jgi:ribosomal-protein-alanine N-acetyltransferase